MNITKPQKMIYNMVKVDGDSVATNCSSLLIDGEKSISDIQAAVNGLFYHNDILRVRKLGYPIAQSVPFCKLVSSSCIIDIDEVLVIERYRSHLIVA